MHQHPPSDPVLRLSLHAHSHYDLFSVRQCADTSPLRTSRTIEEVAKVACYAWWLKGRGGHSRRLLQTTSLTTHTPSLTRHRTCLLVRRFGLSNVQDGHECCTGGRGRRLTPAPATHPGAIRTRSEDATLPTTRLVVCLRVHDILVASSV